MNMDVVRWGMIGCGSVAERKSGPAFYKAPGSALVAVMGRRLEAVTDYATRHGIARVYTDAQALINDPEVDAVYIATPPDSHHAYSLMVAAAGKHCCVEKPMSLNAGQSREMQQVFADAGLHLFVSYYRRSLPRFQQVRQWLEAGRIGEVRHLTWTLTKATGLTCSSTCSATSLKWPVSPRDRPGCMPPKMRSAPRGALLRGRREWAAGTSWRIAARIGSR
jgi:predicted dehydrogenase